MVFRTGSFHRMARVISWSRGIFSPCCPGHMSRKIHGMDTRVLLSQTAIRGNCEEGTCGYDRLRRECTLPRIPEKSEEAICCFPDRVVPSYNTPGPVCAWFCPGTAFLHCGRFIFCTRDGSRMTDQYSFFNIQVSDRFRFRRKRYSGSFMETGALQ